MDEPLKYALKILGVKDYFTCEISEKLTSRFGEEQAEDTIAKLNGYGYLNDERVTKNYISYKLRSGYGPYYIKEKLYQRGIETDISTIDEVAVIENVDMEGIIGKLSEKYKGKKGDARKNYLKCVSFLTGRGFPTGLCFKILKKGDFEE